MIFSAFGNVGFFGSEVSKGTLTTGEKLDVEFNVVNREELVKAQVLVVYELRRISDMSLFFKSEEKLDFAPFEVKKLKKEFSFDDIPGDEYFFTISLRSGSGAPLSFISHDISIENDLESVYFSTLPFLKIYYDHVDGRKTSELSYTNTGRPIVPGDIFEVHFSLNNQQDVSKDLRSEIFMKNSYLGGELEKVYEENISINANERKDFSIEYSHEKAGTYDLFVVIYDEDNKVVGNKEVRVVIIGDGGSLIDVFNHKDVYDVGELGKIDVSLVGPADAMSIVRDVELKMEIFKEDNLIYEDSKEIDELPFNPETYNFVFENDVILDYYKVKVTLRKGDKIYDEVELNYEPLNPDLVISADGRVFDPNVVACFDDGICTDEEKDIGNCLDCFGINDSVEVEEEQNVSEKVEPIEQGVVENENLIMRSFMILILILVPILISILLIYFKNQRGKRK
ncbi:MAG: hypothetical protein ACOC16_04045 [Nanoarchaeota archaeon]